jgi:hypothetical protein
MTSLLIFSVKNDVNVPSKNNKNLEGYVMTKRAGFLEPATEPDLLVRGTDPRYGPGFVPKCHGSGTLLETEKEISVNSNCTLNCTLSKSILSRLVNSNFTLNNTLRKPILSR